MRFAIAAPAVLGAVLRSTTVAAQSSYVAPTSETVFSTTEESQGDPPVHLIFVENRSTVPVTVFSVSLTRCENVKPQCSPRPVRIHVEPGRREIAMRVWGSDRTQPFNYYFGFSWRADSAGLLALAALASGGNTHAQDQLAGIRRADSLDRVGQGPHADFMTRDEFAALAGHELTLRATPDSLVLAPGDRAKLQQLHLFVVDGQGKVLGRTQMIQWSVPQTGALTFTPPDQLVAHAPGRVVLRFQLGDQAQALVQRPVPELDVPVRIAYPADPHAPTFTGVAVDADRHTPLGCADVALEDSAENVVAHARTTRAGAFHLAAPRPGTYRVRVETLGWAPAYGPSELAVADETRQHDYPVRFTEQLLGRHAWDDPDEFRHAAPAAISMAPMPGARATPMVSGVTLGGSASMPVLGIVGRVSPGSTWTQFVVDSTGHVDPTSVLVSPGTDGAALAGVRAMLPRVRFSPARAAGHPTCEMLRMQVTFSSR